MSDNRPVSGLNILVFLGSVREHRMATRVGQYVKKLLESQNHTVTITDPKENALGQVEQPLHFYPDPSAAPAVLVRINKQIQEADGFVVVSAEYNSGMTPALASLMDNFPPLSYAYRPAAIVTYSMGQFGGIRAAMQLRQFLSELNVIHMPSMIVIPKVHEALTADGNSTVAEGQLKKASDAMCKQFEWYASTLKRARQDTTQNVRVKYMEERGVGVAVERLYRSRQYRWSSSTNVRFCMVDRLKNSFDMADQQKAAQDGRDNRSNQLNPNNPQHQPNKANRDNNSNIQNPNNAKSEGHLKGSKPKGN